jgi:hypothetical protein
MNEEDFEDPSIFEDSNFFEEYVEDHSVDFDNENDYIRILAEKGEGLLMIENEDGIIYKDEDNMFDESK